MPLYEYRCRECGAISEHRHGFGESVGEACAACGGELVRHFSPAGIVFKGSGFYVTDSRKSGDSKAAKPKTDSSATDAPKAEATKPDAPQKGDGAPSKGAGESKKGSDAAA